MAKIHTLLLAGIGCLASFTLSAEHLTPDEALARVRGANAPRCSRTASQNAGAQLATTVGDLYLFNTSDGFMILPDDDRAPALLGYSDTGELVLEGNPALQDWLAFYNRELHRLKSAPLPSKKLKGGNGSRAGRSAIAPLLKTEWNQESPYNMLCPKVNGHDVVTGCVATAMAQFMKYYEYPAKGKGRHSYYWEVGKDTLSCDYDTIPFQWNLMTDTYNSSSTEAAKKAVAELMLACGISVDMHYDIGDSGAATSHMGVSLINIFQYSPSLWMAHRDYYGYDEWVGMIYDELSKGNPVLYSGQGTAGGHQFICDGFEGDGYFHFNWGWGGLSNGYFLLTALNPDDLGVGGGAGGFNSDQIATLSARPAQDGDEPTYIMYNGGAFLPMEGTDSVKAGDEFQCQGTYFNYSMSELPEGSKLGMKFVNAATKAAVYVQGPDVAGLHLDEGRYYDYVKFPELEDGTYVITPALHAGGKWSEVKMPLGSPDEITAVVTDNVAKLTGETAASIEIRNVEIPDTIYAAHDCPMTFKAYNDGDLEYYANVTPYLLNSDGTAVATSAYRPMDVLPNATEDVGDYVANFTALSGQTLDAGEYQLVFRNSAGDDISQPVEVNVLTTTDATEIKVSDFRMITASPVTDPASIKFEFLLSCESGVYYNCPHVLIFPGDGGYDLAGATGEKHYLVSGESSDVTVDGDFSQLKDGSYMAAVFDDGSEKSDNIRFEIKRTISAITETAPDTPTDIVLSNIPSEEIYNLQGVRCTRPLLPGLYIINHRMVAVR